MIKTFSLRFGPANSATRLCVVSSAVTVFVGPNNAGKSVAIRELASFATGGSTPSPLVVSGVEFEIPRDDEIRELLVEASEDGFEGRHASIGVLDIAGGGYNRTTVDLENVRRSAAEARALQAQNRPDHQSAHFQHLAQSVFRPFSLMLDGVSRLKLADPAPGGDLLQPASTMLGRLFREDETRREVRELVGAAFGKHLVVDPTELHRLRIRLSESAPPDSRTEQGLDAVSREFHSRATEISQMSDGVRAFVGIACALEATHCRMFFIDEPEAFLHPPLARRLGREMASRLVRRGGRGFAATHSADFLMGCVESGAPVNVIRLTNDLPRPAASEIASEEVGRLMSDPLLRSTGVLSALFHRSAIVCEGDSDRAFYDEVNRRLLDSTPPSGAIDAVFLNAHNKQTLWRIVAPLRRVGIPAAAIGDLDMIKSGSQLEELLVACNVPEAVRQALGQLRGQVARRFEDAEIAPSAGISSLTGERRAECQELIEQLAEYGVFLVPCGEVERWLPDDVPSARKGNWLASTFAAMGSNPQDADYMRPRDNDVWDFVRAVATWLSKPDRKGMPVDRGSNPR